MVLQCCVRGCETVGNSGFHSFPKNKVSAERWIVATKSHHLIDRLAANKLSNSFYKLCRKHFADSDFTKNGKGQIIVKKESTPSLFLPDGLPVHLPTRMSEKPVKPEERSHLPINNTSMNQSRTEVDDDNYIDVEALSSEEEVREKTGQKQTKRSRDTIVFPKSRTLSYYKRRVKFLQEKVKNNKLNDSAVISYLQTKFNEQLMEFIIMQLKNAGRSKFGRRYSPKQKSLCLAMYKQGPKSYRFNEKWCCLPTKRTLARYSAELIFQSGVDLKLLEALKTVVTNWPEENKYCSIGWDEVSLSGHLDYCHSLDKIEGFVNQEMGRPKGPVFATHSLTFMIRGIQVSYKQSIGYFYTNGLKSFELVELIRLMVDRVQIIGLKPILSVCDTCSTNATAVNELAYPNVHQTKQTGDLLQYTVNGQTITHVYDPSHLIKVVRNNFQIKNIAHFVTERWHPGFEEYDDGFLQIAVWDDIDVIYRIDLESTTERSLKKLTDEHLKPSRLKMKVSVAAQVFSNACGSYMLECVEKKRVKSDFTSTARLILFVNDLFDSINGSEKHPADSLKGAVMPNSKHFEFWDYALVMLENMFYLDKTTAERNNRSSVLKKFESTIRGYKAIAETCFKSNITKVNIRDTTQDGLENFFGCVKSCNQSTKTTATQYRTGYATMVINNITGTNSLKSNCEPDSSIAILSNVHDFISVCKEQPLHQAIVSYPERKLCEDENFLVEWESDDEDSLISFDPETESDFSSAVGLNNRTDAGSVGFNNRDAGAIDLYYRSFAGAAGLNNRSEGAALGLNNRKNSGADGFNNRTDAGAFDLYYRSVAGAAGLNNRSDGGNVKVGLTHVSSTDSNRICQQLYKSTSCVTCKDNFELADRNATLRSIEKLVVSLNKTIAGICYQESIKSKLLDSVKDAKVHIVGCSEHIDVLERKIKNIAVDHIILGFCNHINKILSGKIKELPDEPNCMEKLAFEHRVKKRDIGKFSDKFIEQ